MLTPCRDADDLAAIVRDSTERPILIFKHSSRCGISARAIREVEAFAEEHPEHECRIVMVVEQRPLSLAIAEQTGITHQSPQALLLKSGTVVWHTSHSSISAFALQEAFAAAS